MSLRVLFLAGAIICTPASLSAQNFDFGINYAAGEVALNNSAPFGNVSDAQYQQVYAASVFGSDPVRLSEIQFQNLGYNYLPTTFSRLTIGLSTTNKNIGALDLNFAANRGSDLTVLYDDTYIIDTTQPISPTGFNLIFKLDQIFTYDPADGNLLVDFTITGVNGSGAPALASFQTGLSSRLVSFFPEASSGRADNYSLATRFVSVPSVAAVPEPASWAMMLLGFGFVGGALRSARIKRSKITFATA